MNLLHPDGLGVTVSSSCASLIFSDSRSCIFFRLFSNSSKYCICFSKSTLSSLYIPRKTFISWHLSSILRLCFKATLNFFQTTRDEYGSGALDALALFRSNSSSCKSWDNSLMRSRQHSRSSSQKSFTLSFCSSGSPMDSVGISVISGDDIPVKWDDSQISEPGLCVSSCKRFSSWLVWLWLVLALLGTWLSVCLFMSVHLLNLLGETFMHNWIWSFRMTSNILKDQCLKKLWCLCMLLTVQHSKRPMMMS